MFRRSTSPYITNPTRLADLIAAIQVMGTYNFASRPLSKWENRLGRKPVSSDEWLTIFKEHPEFFTIQGEEISLVWRRSRERIYDTLKSAVLSNDEAAVIKAKEIELGEKRLSRPPLDTTEISKLVDIAINLHEREIQHQQERRWWLTAVITILGLIVTLATK